MFPLNDNYFWATTYLHEPNANIEFVSQIPEEKFSIDLKTGIKLNSNTSFTKVEKHTPAHNMTHSFNEVSIEWNNKKILWKLNDQLINNVDLKNFSAGNESIAQIFNNRFSLIMALTLRREFYNGSNFNLSNVFQYKPYLYIDYIRVYKPKETKTITNPVQHKEKKRNEKKKEIDLHSNVGANNANSFLNTNKTIPTLLVILVVFIL
jgi:hypothetical protein